MSNEDNASFITKNKQWDYKKSFGLNDDIANRDMSC
jgi:hypothetical protein